MSQPDLLSIRISYFDAAYARSLESPVLEALTIEDAESAAAGESHRRFRLSARLDNGTEGGFKLPVACLRPAKADTAQVLDLMPNGKPKGYATWLDLCDVDLEADFRAAGNAARVGIRSSGCQFGSFAFNGAAALPVELIVGLGVVVRINENGMAIGSKNGTASHHYHALAKDDRKAEVNAAFYSVGGAGSGSIGTLSNHAFTFVTGGVDRWVLERSGDFVPVKDRDCSLGSAEIRLKNTYAAAINLSSAALESSADQSGEVGEVRVHGEYIYYKTEAGWRRLRGDLF